MDMDLRNDDRLHARAAAPNLVEQNIDIVDKDKRQRTEKRFTILGDQSNLYRHYCL